MHRWFDIQDRQLFKCRSKICECIQALERKSASWAPSVKLSHSRKSKASGKSTLSSSSTKHLSLALVINQQKINYLPVKELPVFSGDYSEYPAFVIAFDYIISKCAFKQRLTLFLEQILCLPEYNAHFFPLKLTSKFAVHIVHGTYCLVMFSLAYCKRKTQKLHCNWFLITVVR